VERQHTFAHSPRGTRLPRYLRGPRATRLAVGLLFTASLGLAAARAAPRCGTEHDQSVFELEALKTELVVATDCHDQDQYNEFVQRYRPQLANTEHEFDSYYNHLLGKKGQHARDEYVTALANADSSAAQAIGRDYCPRNGVLFGEVMALPNPTQLPAYAAGKDLIPAALGACETVPVAAPAARPTRHRRTHTK